MSVNHQAVKHPGSPRRRLRWFGLSLEGPTVIRTAEHPPAKVLYVGQVEVKKAVLFLKKLHPFEIPCSTFYVQYVKNADRHSLINL